MDSFGFSVEAKAISLGLMMHPRGEAGGVGGGGWVTTPITTQPLVLPQQSFDYVTSLMPLWNTVLNRVAHDATFLVEAIEPIASSDPFTRRILDMYKKLYVENKTGESAALQTAKLGIFRSDYMRDDVAVKKGDHAGEWKHIEINTIAASFGALSTRAGQIQKYVDEVLKPKPSPFSTLDWSKIDTQKHGPIQVSQSLEEIASGFDGALRVWKSQFPNVLEEKHGDGGSSLVPVVCFVVDTTERNTADQYQLAMRAQEEYGIVSIRKSFADLASEMQLVGGDGQKTPPHAIIREKGSNIKMVVTTFYFRTGYHPSQFPDEVSWQSREKIELSSALKCPSLPHYLCTWKQIQQLLAHEDVLAKFVASPEEQKLLQASFVGQYPVGSYIDREPVARAIQNPDAFVLKSQLEGGGNLIFGEEMKSLLLEARDPSRKDSPSATKTREEYILMERIVSSVHPGGILKPGGAVETFDALVPELGTFGVLVYQDEEKGIVENRSAGYLVRTKPIAVADGGIMSGLSALDTIAFST